MLCKELVVPGQCSFVCGLACTLFAQLRLGSVHPYLVTACDVFEFSETRQADKALCLARQSGRY